jgi:hypothetical protein
MFSPQIIKSKLEGLLSAAPDANFDCSKLFDPQKLLSALKHAASNHAG